MPNRAVKASATESAIRAHVERIFAEQKHRIGMCAPSAWATTEIGRAILVHNTRRLLWLERRTALT